MENNSPYNFNKTYNTTPLITQQVNTKVSKNRSWIWVALAIIIAAFIFFVLYFLGRSVYNISL